MKEQQKFGLPVNLNRKAISGKTAGGTRRERGLAVPRGDSGKTMKESV